MDVHNLQSGIFFKSNVLYVPVQAQNCSVMGQLLPAVSAAGLAAFVSHSTHRNC